MKAEERHELRENDLANWLHYGLWAFLRQNGSYLLLVLALCFLGYRLYAFYQQKQENARILAYQDLESAINSESDTIAKGGFDVNLSPAELAASAKNDADAGRLSMAAAKYQAIISKASATDQQKQDAYVQFMAVMQKQTDNTLRTFQNIIETSTNPQIKAQASLELGRLYATLAARPQQTQFTRPDCLSKAFDAYSKALEFQGDDALIAGKAHLGIAGVYEDQGDGWDKAKAEYQKIIDGPLFAGTALVDLAKDRLASLNDRRNAPRLAAWKPPVMLPPIPSPSSGGVLSTLPSGLINPGIMGPTNASGFQGLMLGPPSPGAAPSTSPFNFGTPLAPMGNPLLPMPMPLTPSTAPAPEPK